MNSSRFRRTREKPIQLASSPAETPSTESLPVIFFAPAGLASLNFRSLACSARRLFSSPSTGSLQRQSLKA